MSGGCDTGPADGPLDIAVIGELGELASSDSHWSFGGQHLRAATAEGLVALDPAGQVVPAIAERWIVTDDGSSYIFRLRDSTWVDGEPIAAEEVARLLELAIERTDGTPLALDLAKVMQIRAMTGRIVEVQLSSPMPEFLRLLAQPELGLIARGSGAGPMVLSRDEETQLVRLSALPPPERGLPARADWEDTARALTVRALPAAFAVEAFDSGAVDLVLGGTIVDFPLAQLGPLSRGTIRVDPALGLFGLVILNEDGVLSDADRREALSMAIDRPALIAPFGLGGWRPITWIVPHTLFSPLRYPETRWNDLSIEQRRSQARNRVAEFAARTGEKPRIALAIPAGPGGDLLFRQLAEQWRTIGVDTVRAQPGKRADMIMLDRLARYSSPRWFLNQLQCSREDGPCAPVADALVRESLVLQDAGEKQALLAEAHSELVAAEAFIPLGIPVRWSLVRGAVRGYEPNPWGLHPLFPLSQPTI